MPMLFAFLALLLFLCPTHGSTTSCDQVVPRITRADVEAVKKAIKQRLSTSHYISYERTYCNPSTGELIDPYQAGQNYYLRLLISKYRSATTRHKQFCLVLGAAHLEALNEVEAQLEQRFPFRENGIWVTGEVF